jgi:phosphoglycolate phosphatase
MIVYFIDLDGTIENSKRDMSLCVNAVRKQLLLEPLRLNYIEKFVNKGMRELYQNCFSDYIDTTRHGYNIVKKKYEDYYLSHACIHTTCYEGMPQTIAALSQKGKVIVVTNKPEKISRQLLKELNLLSHITDVMGGDSCSQCKPSAMPLTISANKLNFDKQTDSAFMIGDSEGDIRCAMEFGAQSVWCSWGYLKKFPNLKPDFVAHTPQDLLNL